MAGRRELRWSRVTAAAGGQGESADTAWVASRGPSLSFHTSCHQAAFANVGCCDHGLLACGGCVPGVDACGCLLHTALASQ